MCQSTFVLNTKTKVTTTEEIHHFSVDNEDIKIVKAFAYIGSVIPSDGHCSQAIKRRLRFRRAAMEELGEIVKSKDVSLRDQT